MRKLRIILATILLLTVIGSGLLLLLPKPSNVADAMYYSPIASAVVVIDLLLALGSGVLFLMALPSFKPELKPAYRFMAFSTLAVGLLLIFFPFIEYYDWWDILFFNIVSYAQYFIGAPLMYLGVRKFYKSLGCKGWPANIGVVLLIVAILSVVHAVIPHFEVWPQFSEAGYDFFEVVTIMPLVIYAMAFYMAWRVRQRTGQVYKKAFTWLTVGTFFYVVNTLGIVVLETIGYENWYFDHRVYTIPAIMGDLSLVLAGYSFAAIGRLKSAPKKESEAFTSIDVIIYISEMSSDQIRIDPYLDALRVTTATLGPNQPLTPIQQNKLKEVYLAIEKYLVEEDVLRNHTREELRQIIVDHFDLTHRGGDTFWPLLSV